MKAGRSPAATPIGTELRRPVGRAGWLLPAASPMEQSRVRSIECASIAKGLLSAHWRIQLKDLAERRRRYCVHIEIHRARIGRTSATTASPALSGLEPVPPRMDKSPARATIRCWAARTADTAKQFDAIARTTPVAAARWWTG